MHGDRISKFGGVFQNVYYSFRLGYYVQKETKSALYLDFFIFAYRTVANICVSLKDSDVKHNFDNVTSRTKSFTFPLDVLVDGKCEMNIDGLFVVERDEYPIIPRLICTGNYELWKKDDKDFTIIIDNENEVAKVMVNEIVNDY